MTTYAYTVEADGVQLGAFEKLADALCAMIIARRQYSRIDLLKDRIVIRYARKQPNGKWVSA